MSNILEEVKSLLSQWKSNVRYKLSEEHLKFINENTPLLQSKEFSLGTKLNWIIHGITEFPKCKVCRKRI